MGTTRTNFYKNPSFAYNRDFSLSSVLQNLRAYNLATGNSSPPIEDSHPIDQKKFRKRLHDQRPKSDQDERSLDENYGPLSHENYIDKRRKEIGSSQVYQELTPDVLENFNSSFQPLVQYESDERTSSGEHEEKHDAPSSDYLDEADRIKKRVEQRFPVPGEPACVVCGRYGEYICNETGDDICSADCKAELLIEKNGKAELLKAQSLDLAKGVISCQDSLLSLSGHKRMLQLSEFNEDDWDFGRNRWTKKRSSLCTYECWKCQKPGHLAEDCLVTTCISPSSSTSTCSQVPMGACNSSSISRDLLALYRRCHQIGKSLRTAKCNICRASSSLAMCLDCSVIFCDSAGHLNEHITSHPSHRQFYSYKLQRLVKCCKSTCNVTDIKDLLVCHYCLDKAFDKFYDMYTATWFSYRRHLYRSSQ
ncbi:zinc finger protein [Macleaya cordata]|uniref:Zinc finger protein n=1 Tax=Macleaya cordata TaxID=56857 RepID=A0A200QHC5_MACCD|nr:zinc finger protein [Macleaya cordata]